MGRGDKGMVGTFSLIALVCSVLSTCAVFSLRSQGHPQFLIPAILARDLSLDMYVIVLSVVGMSYAYAQKRSQKVLQQIYTCMLVVLGISILALGVLFYVLPNSKSLEGNPKWFRAGLVEGTAWKSFTSCMKEDKFCEKPLHLNSTAPQINFKHNCCQVPPECKNGTTQDQRFDGAKNNDCSKWSNNRDELCFGCDTCKVQLIVAFTRTTYSFICRIFFYAIFFMLGWLGFE